MYRDSWWFRVQDVVLDHPWLKVVAVVIGLSVVANFCLSMYMHRLFASIRYESFDDPAQIQAVLDEIVKVKIPPNFKPTQGVRSSNNNIAMVMATYIDKGADAQLAFCQSMPSHADAGPMETFAYGAARQFDTHWGESPDEPVVRLQPVKIRGRQCSLRIIEERVPELKKFHRSAMVSFAGQHGSVGFAISYYGDSLKLDEIVKMLETLE
jgi:hypothetical protein